MVDHLVEPAVARVLQLPRHRQFPQRAFADSFPRSVGKKVKRHQMDGGFVHDQVLVVRLEDLLPRHRQRKGRPFSLVTDVAGIQHRGGDKTHILRAFGPWCAHTALENPQPSVRGQLLSNSSWCNSVAARRWRRLPPPRKASARARQRRRMGCSRKQDRPVPARYGPSPGPTIRLCPKARRPSDLRCGFRAATRSLPRVFGVLFRNEIPLLHFLCALSWLLPLLSLGLRASAASVLRSHTLPRPRGARDHREAASIPGPDRSSAHRPRSRRLCSTRVVAFARLHSRHHYRPVRAPPLARRAVAPT